MIQPLNRKANKGRAKERLANEIAQAEEAGDEEKIKELRMGKRRRRNRKPPEEAALRVGFDCQFEHLMSEKEVISVGRQVQCCYHHNQELQKQCWMMLSSFGGGLQHRLEKANYKHWPGVVANPKRFDEAFKKEDIVYLTAESENTLEEIDQSKLYIIGAIVDRNREKGLCHQLATDAGVQTARLPISEHMEMSTRVVITIDQVFQIVLQLYNGAPMAEALAAAMPSRKGWEMKEDGEEDQEDVAEPKVKGAAEQHSAEPDGAKQGSVEAEAKETSL